MHFLKCYLIYIQHNGINWKKEKTFVFPSYLLIIEQELGLYYWAIISGSLKWEHLNMKILIIYECIC